MLNATATTLNVAPSATSTGVGGLIVVGVLLFVSVAALVSIWTRPLNLKWRLIWSLVVLVPFLGPLVYAAIVIMYPSSPTPGSTPPTVYVKPDGSDLG